MHAPLWRRLGRTDILLSPLVMGTWQAGKQYWTGIDDGDMTRAIRTASPEHYPRVLAALERLRALADELGTGMSRLALAWLMAQPGTIPIAGARNSDQVRDNAAAMDLSLPAEVIARMDVIGSVVAAPLSGDPVAWHWQP